MLKVVKICIDIIVIREFLYPPITKQYKRQYCALFFLNWGVKVKLFPCIPEPKNLLLVECQINFRHHREAQGAHPHLDGFKELLRCFSCYLPITPTIYFF